VVWILPPSKATKQVQDSLCCAVFPLPVPAAEQYNATTQQLQQQQQAQQQQDGSSGRKSRHQQQQPPFTDCKYIMLGPAIALLLLLHLPTGL